MELVDGVPVDQYCDEHKLTIDQRLDLFRAICAGVQYAHENLVVHRDIKPDNILVTRDGVPKLLILVGATRRLITTVTAFTLAHSLTLALATLGFVQIPQRPVEAVIALSIVFVAAEILHGMAGRPGITARQPRLVAFTFGLLDGLGFAGALGDIGLPTQAIPLALLCFNVGVELGQLAFIAAVLAVGALLRRLRVAWPPWSWYVPPYAIGGVAAYWTIARLMPALTRRLLASSSDPPAMAPTMRKGSAPAATGSGSGASAGSCDRSRAVAKKRIKGRRCWVTWSRMVPSRAGSRALQRVQHGADGRRPSTSRATSRSTRARDHR